MKWPDKTEVLPSGETAEWIKHIADDDLAVLVALYDAAGDDPLPDWGVQLYAEIRERTEARMRDEVAKLTEEQFAVELPADPTDLSQWITAKMVRANGTQADSLRTLALALGLPVPMRRRRPPKPPPAEQPEKATPDSPESENAADRSIGGLPEEPDLHDLHEPEPPILGVGVDDDAGWTEADSLYDAIHGDERGWY